MPDKSLALTRRSLLGMVVALPVLIPGGSYREYAWRTAQGEDIRISDLEDGHLLNIERMLRGDGRQSYERPDRNEAHVIIIKEVAKRGLRTRPALWAVRGQRDLFEGIDDNPFMDEEDWSS